MVNFYGSDFMLSTASDFFSPLFWFFSFIALCALGNSLPSALRLSFSLLSPPPPPPPPPFFFSTLMRIYFPDLITRH